MGHPYSLGTVHSDRTSSPEDGVRGTPRWVGGPVAEADGLGGGVVRSTEECVFQAITKGYQLIGDLLDRFLT